MADENSIRVLRRIFPRKTPSLSPYPNKSQCMSSSRNRPGLSYPSLAMGLCPLTKSMSLWCKRDRRSAQKLKSRNARNVGVGSSRRNTVVR